MHSNFPGYQFLRKNVDLEKFQFFFFSDIEQKHFALIATSLYREKEDFILLQQRIFFGEHIFKKRCNLHFLRVWAKIIKRPANLFRWKCQNCILRFQRNNVGVYFFREKYHLLIFLGFEWKTLQFYQKFSNRFVKTAFLCSEEHFRWEFFLMEIIILYCYSG